MSQELLAIIDQMEREKGIKKEILVQAIESALASAARKVLNTTPEEELRVELDRETGKIHAFRDNKEVLNMDFSRIAASTARQVIIQKIREAEKDVVFSEFQGRVGEIVSGTVYRFEKGNIIVDLLGKAEGVLLKREQAPNEDFRQGQRIRTYVVDVKKDTKGPQIILSRTHPSLVKKLFELEVPEIFEGIVEVRSIARQAGERTKIAVCSKNEKVDSVGACVGMRGNRVRNIVSELNGEKIDIVRYNDDIREYIRAALSPAKIAEIKLDKEKMKAEVIVDDDQLSLAIGKHGQNVRLASRLVGWELDIRTKAMIAAALLSNIGKVKTEAEAPAQGEAAEVSAVEEEAPASRKKAKTKAKPKAKPKAKAAKEEKKEAAEGLAALDGIGEKTMKGLQAAGFNTLEDVAKASVEDLSRVKGIGEKKAEKLIKQAKQAGK